MAGESPLKRGRRPKCGADTTGQLARQAAMMQAAGEGGSNFASMDAAVKAMTTGTKCEGMSTKHMSKKLDGASGNVQSSMCQE